MPLFDFDPIERTQTIDESFTTINDNFEAIDTGFQGVESSISNLAGAIQTLDEQAVRIKIFQAEVAIGNQTLFTLPEQYAPGRLIVFSGGLLAVPGTHWTETSSTEFTFTEGRVAGEIVQAIEIQVGDGDTVPFPIGTVSVYTTTEYAEGTINSTNGTDGNGIFIVDKPIRVGSTPTVKISGIIELVPTTDFTWSGVTITILAPQKPIVGESVVVNYQWTE